MINRPTTSEDGFTILEAIVAMTILALVLGIASQSVILARSSVDAARTRVELTKNVQELITRLEMAQAPATEASAKEAERYGLSVTVSSVGIADGTVNAIMISDTGGNSGASFLTFLPQSPSVSQ